MEEISIVLIGHKDHGKSTLIGRLLLDTHSVKTSRVDDIKKIDEDAGRVFELAHIMDSFKEEREREMTMDTTRAVLKGKERIYQLIDVPGHAELIAQMLTGASNAQAALLMVSAFEGIEEQTRQHLEIIKILGIDRLAVLVNKLDKFDFSQEKFNEIVSRLNHILLDVGFPTDKINYFPVSAFWGDNIINRSEKTPWYSGMTIMEFIEQEIQPLPPLENLPFRFLVQDKYDLFEQDVLVGQVLSGKIKKGDRVIVYPENEEQKVSLIKEANFDLLEAKARSNVGLVLEKNTLAVRGSVISHPEQPPEIGRDLAGEVFWIKTPVSEDLILGCGTAQAVGKLINGLPEQDGIKSFYQFQSDKPLAFDRKSRTILSKIVFKQNGQLIGVGTVE